jgi:uncharacterized protein
MRSIPSDFDPEAVAAIGRRLETVRREHKVALPLVIESGSRAWGFRPEPSRRKPRIGRLPLR